MECSYLNARKYWLLLCAGTLDGGTWDSPSQQHLSGSPAGRFKSDGDQACQFRI